jgi:hypothetical protein
VSAIDYLDANGAVYVYGNPGLTVQQAYNIDKKIDDGFPQSGLVVVQYQAWNISNSGLVWAQGAGINGPSGTQATPQLTTSCYDNGGNAGTTQQYSLGATANGGTGLNCALSFRFQ